MIGVIGGNGVAATNKLMQLIEEQFTKNGAFRDAHHPEIIVWQATQAPSRSMYLEGRGPSFIDDYVRIGLKLKECGCTTLCMCCNTAHYAIEELKREIQLPFINLINEVAYNVARGGYSRVFILCSDGCRQTNLYDKSFAEIVPNVQVIYPDEDEQKLVTKGICNAKNIQRYGDERNVENPANCFQSVIDKMIAQYGIDDKTCVIAGCTDIRNVFRLHNSKIPYIDSLEVLKDCICKIGNV